MHLENYLGVKSSKMKDESIMLITGTSKGVGRHLAKYYLEKGIKVLGCSTSAAELKHSNYTHYITDVSDHGAVLEMFASIRKEHKRLDYLINNAGVSNTNLVITTDESAVKKIVEVNIEGRINVTKNSVRLMQKNRFGRIVNISSIRVPLTSVGSSIYSGSKAFVEQFGKVLSKEVALMGITVNTVGLSVVEGVGMASDLSEKNIEETINSTILKKLITIEDVVSTIDFFISPKSKAITGQTIYVGGE